MALIETRPGERIRPLRSRLRVELLSDSEVERIVDACFGLLERVGLQIDSEPVLRDLAVDVIEGGAGPAGHFLDSPHTLAHMRERWMSDLFDTENWDAWVDAGRPEPKDRAREKARAILSTHEPEPLPEDVDAERQAIVARREADILDEV